MHILSDRGIKITALFSFIVVSLTLSVARAQGNGPVLPNHFGCSPVSPDASLDEIVEWAENMDLIGNRHLRQSHGDDRRLQFGNLVDSSCFQNKDQEQWEDLKERMEQALGFAMSQAQRCFVTLGLGAMTDVISRLRRTKIHCSETEGTAAAARLNHSDGYHTPHWNREYNLVSWGGYMNTKSIETIASTLIHESLHWSVHNHRTWHNDAGEYNFSGCDRSVFKDRVYLMQAACFPTSLKGRRFYNKNNGAYKCSDVCYDALTEVEEGALDKFRNHPEVNADSLTGFSYGPEEARRICNRIKKVPERYAEASDLKIELHNRNNRFQEMLVRWFGGEERTYLQGRFDHAKNIINDAFKPDANVSQSIEKVRRIRRQVDNFLKNRCKEPKSPDLINYCFNHRPKEHVVSELDRMLLRMEEINPHHMNLYTGAPRLPALHFADKDSGEGGASDE